MRFCRSLPASQHVHRSNNEPFVVLVNPCPNLLLLVIYCCAPLPKMRRVPCKLFSAWLPVTCPPPDPAHSPSKKTMPIARSNR